MKSRLPPSVSVIVPVFNAPRTLKTLFKALDAQDYPADLLEFIFVDNGSTDDSFQRLTEFSSIPRASVKVDKESASVGSYAARNKGIEIASGVILAFTDADCMPDPTWIKQGVQALVQKGSRVFVGGQVRLLPQCTALPTTVEKFDMVFGFSQEDNVNRRGYSVTANLMAWRETFVQVGAFNDQLKSKGDYEWCRRATSQGYRPFYCHSSVVNHPARHSLAQLLTKARRVAGGQFNLRSINPERNELAMAQSEKPGVILKVRRLWRSPVLHGAKDRISVFGVAALVFFVGQAEKLRLACGGRTERR